MEAGGYSLRSTPTVGEYGSQVTWRRAEPLECSVERCLTVQRRLGGGLVYRNPGFRVAIEAAID